MFNPQSHLLINLSLIGDGAIVRIKNSTHFLSVRKVQDLTYGYTKLLTQPNAMHICRRLSASGRVTRSQVKIRTGEDARTTTTEVTTTVNIRKRGRPEKRTSISDTGQVGVRSSIEIRNGGDIAERTLSIAHPTASVRKRGRPRKRKETDSGDATKRRDDGTLEETTPNGAKNRTSSIKQHLSARTNWRELYSDNVFSILSRGRCALHLAVLEALYIRTKIVRATRGE